MAIGYIQGDYEPGIIVLVRIMIYMVTTLRLNLMNSLIVNIAITLLQLALDFSRKL